MGDAISVIACAILVWVLLMWVGDHASKSRQIKLYEDLQRYWSSRVADAERTNHAEIEAAYKRGIRETHFKFTGEHLP